MNPQRLMTVPCKVITRVAGGTDPYGAKLITEASSDARCWYSNPTTEERGGQVFQTLTVYFAPDVVLDEVTRLEIEGAGDYEVDGRPLAHRSPRTGVPTHQTVKVRAGA